MLQIVLPENELFNEKTGEFVTVKSRVIQLEHSLISISKWESKWKKPFLLPNPKSTEESIDYIKCMTITQNVSELDYLSINIEILNKVNAYIDDSMTATNINRRSAGRGREVVTSELIYFWMVHFGIPFECQKWHLNRLLMLIQICDIKGAPQQKMSRQDIFSQNKALNASRRQRLGSRG